MSVNGGTTGYPQQFQPAPFVKPESEVEYVQLRARNFILLLGMLVLSLAFLYPLWDTGLMLTNPTVVFFIGQETPIRIIITCIGWLVFWIITVVLFFSCARKDTHTETSIISLVGMTLTGLGVCLLVLAQTLDSDTTSVAANIYTHCGVTYAELIDVSTALQILRLSDDCKKQQSVEDCDGYVANQPYTGFLKYMELKYKCAGFCFSSYNITANQTHAVEATSLLDTKGSPSPLSLRASQVVASLHSQLEEPLLLAKRRYKRAKAVRRGTLAGAIDDLAAAQRHSHPVVMLSTDNSTGNGTLSNSTSGHANIPNGTYVTYPPTLFSLNNYQASCDAMAARDIQWSAQQPASTLYVGALTLILCSVVVPLGKLMTMCKDGRQYKERMRRAAGQH